VFFNTVNDMAKKEKEKWAKKLFKSGVIENEINS
jgi:hypothetical protein